MSVQLTILECTLRDGSYAIDFQFTREDTLAIAGALDAAGFEMIEIGHGVGMGAQESGKGFAAESDETYMLAAAQAVRHGRWGMFCIPGIARIDHLRMAVDHGMDFVRIGTNIDRIDESRPFIDEARKLGLMVITNFMKSYALPPAEFAQLARRSHEFGAEIVYLVDSAGGMLPEDVQAYVGAARDWTPDIRLGFHGHNNLGLGVANLLVAVRAGVELVDTSLQGMGRSTGNPPTEQVLCVLSRDPRFAQKMDALTVMAIGRRHIQPFLTNHGIDSLDIVSGHAQFHTSHMPLIQKYATRYRVDPHHLIIAVCRRDKLSVSDSLVDEEAERLSREGVRGGRLLFGRYPGQEQG
ncbi:MAG: 4-hydroxy-2-oxovalerate aldolase [Magnetococcus sp. YQC-9]